MSIRATISAVIGVVAVVILLLLTPKHEHMPKGIFLPSNQQSQAKVSPQEVMIYHQAPLGNYQTLGQIRAEMAFLATPSKSKDVLYRYVKQLAAAHGANAVVVQVLVPDDGVQRAFTFIGTAIYLSKQDNKIEGA